MWTRRRCETVEDRHVVKTLWLKSHAYSPYGRRAGITVNRLVEEDGEQVWRWRREPGAYETYRAAHEPVVEALMRQFGVDMLVDSVAPDTILAFVCQGRGVVHMAVCKRKFKEYAGQIFQTLLDQTNAVVYTHDMPDMLKLHKGRMPVGWRYDEFWLGRWAVR